eukprot:gene9224-1510_t
MLEVGSENSRNVINRNSLPCWYNGVFLKSTGLASLVWALIVVLSTYISMTLIQQGSPISTRNRYEKYFKPLLQNETLLLFAIHLMLCLSCTIDSIMQFKFLPHETTLHILAIISSALLLTIDYIFMEKSVLVYPAQNISCNSRLTSSILDAFSFGYRMALRMTIGLILSFISIFSLCPTLHSNVFDPIYIVLCGKTACIADAPTTYLVSISTTINLYLSLFVALSLSAASRSIAQIHITHIPPSGIRIESIQELCQSLDCGDHVQKLTISLLLNSLKQAPSFAKDFFSIDANGQSQWRVVSKFCIKTLNDCLSRTSPLSAGSALSFDNKSTISNDQDKLQQVSIPNLGRLTELHRRVTMLDRFSIWPYLTQREAHYILQGQFDGCFVVHASDRSSHLTLTVTHDTLEGNGRGHNLMWSGYITQVENEYCLVGREQMERFPSLEDLIMFYSSCPYNVNFAGQKLYLRAYHKDNVLDTLWHKLRSFLGLTCRRWLLRFPGVHLLVTELGTEVFQSQLAKAEVVTSVLELTACVFETAVVADKHTHERLRHELEQWMIVLSRLHFALSHIEQSYLEPDQSSVDYNNRRRLRACVPNRSRRIKGMKHAVLTSFARICKAYEKEAKKLLHKVDREIFRHLPQWDEVKVIQPSPSWPSI